jgi:hypothetical protein
MLRHPMKLIFPILRLNWYRVVASTIDQALSDGHTVECWHHSGGNHWPNNRPDRSRIPAFRHGAVLVRDFEDDAAFMALCDEHSPDAILSISLVWNSLLDAWMRRSPRPAWVLLATNDSLASCNRPEQLAACDLIALRSPHERECLVEDHTADLGPILEELRRHPQRHGRLYADLFPARAAGRWTPDMVRLFRDRSVCTGYPLLDTVRDIDTDALRSRWGIPAGQPVVGCLASPYGSVMGAPWEKGFVSRNPLGRLFWSLRERGPAGLRVPPNEAEVMRALRRFCDANNAFLLLKMRHSQSADPLMNRVADRILGEESHYPHTAVEMAALAQPVFGFFTTGAPEAVAAKHAFVDLRIPGYNRDMWERAASMFVGMFDHPGVSRSLEAREWIAKAPKMRIEDFQCAPDALAAYNLRFCGPMDGKHSARVIAAVRNHLAGRAIGEDAEGFVMLSSTPSGLPELP